MIGDTNMPKVADPKLKNEGGTYFSQLDAIRNYEKRLDEKADNVRLRVINGGNQALKKYVELMRSEHPEDERYSSLNTFIISVLEEETGLELKIPPEADGGKKRGRKKKDVL